MIFFAFTDFCLCVFAPWQPSNVDCMWLAATPPPFALTLQYEYYVYTHIFLTLYTKPKCIFNCINSSIRFWGNVSLSCEPQVSRETKFAYLKWNISSSTIEGKKSFNSENYYIEKQPYWDGIKIFWRRSENDVNISGVCVILAKTCLL